MHENVWECWSVPSGTKTLIIQMQQVENLVYFLVLVDGDSVCSQNIKFWLQEEGKFYLMEQKNYPD